MPAKKTTKTAKATVINDRPKVTRVKYSNDSSGFYFLGFLGAAVYYISTATGFWDGVLGFLKALIWPLFLVYEALKFFMA